MRNIFLFFCRYVYLSVGLVLSLFLVTSVQAEQVSVAVAANFAVPMKRLAAEFEKRSGHTVVLSFGATGKFYAQISNAAPFDVLLAADQATPARLTAEHTAVADSQFTYATGKLVLWSATPGFVDAQGAVLKRGDFMHIAIAAPKLAPYGAAAMETLIKLNLLPGLTSKLVQGESIGQTYNYVLSGNAEIGFVALSQVWQDKKLIRGSVWVVPDNLYSPLYQDAVLLTRAKDNKAAQALLDYLKTESARRIIRAYGYTF